MRHIAPVTVSRADFGILRPVLAALADGFTVELIAAGTAPADASVLEALDADGLRPSAVVDTLPASDQPVAIGRAIGKAVAAFGDAYDRIKPEVVLLIGDRFETAAAALAAVPFALPVAHVHGGELTEGAIDEQLRHAITKMSHLHFVAGDRQAERVIQMGEEPWRVTVTGAPALDQLTQMRLLSIEELEQRVGLRLNVPPLLVTYHPETIDFVSAEAHVQEFLAALDTFTGPVIVTAPNVDTAHGTVRRLLQEWVAGRPSARWVESLGTQAYWSIMAIAAAMAGNSSSGIIEAASFRLPVVDVGRRQAGRDRPRNVIRADNDRVAIARALQRALDSEFRQTLEDLANPYGDGHAADRIARVLADTNGDARLTTKRFHHIAIE